MFSPSRYKKTRMRKSIASNYESNKAFAFEDEKDFDAFFRQAFETVNQKCSLNPA